MTPEAAERTLMRAHVYSQLNPKGFRSPPHGKRMYARDPKPTLMERLAHEAYGEPLPTRERSPRALRRIEAARKRREFADARA